MSQETLEIVTSRKIEEVQLQLALQCAPLIAGSDISWYVLLNSAVSEAKRCNTNIERIHSSSATALTSVLRNHINTDL